MLSFSETQVMTHSNWVSCRPVWTHLVWKRSAFFLRTPLRTQDAKSPWTPAFPHPDAVWLAAWSPCCLTSLQRQAELWAEINPFSTKMLLLSILWWEGRKLRAFAERNPWTLKTLLSGKTARDGWQMRRQNYSLHHESPEAFVYVSTVSTVTVKSPYHINEIQVILSASTRWHQNKNKNKAQTPFIPSFNQSALAAK